MFTGIVETTGIVKEVIPNGSNLTCWIGSTISSELKADQSLCHDGVCLTVEATREGEHRITAVRETLEKTNLGNWQPGTIVNLERALPATGRLDGHLVQGHVDGKGICLKRKDKKGSWEFEFAIPKKFAELVIDKGAVCINGISLTCFGVKRKSFSVAVIPFTMAHTNLNVLKEGDSVNIEFDLAGKYLLRRLSLKEKQR